MPRAERVKIFLRGLVTLVALVVVAGGIGVALGIGLSALSADEEPAATGGGPGAVVEPKFDAAETTTGSTQPSAPIPAETATATVPAVPAATTRTPSAPSGRFAQVRVSVLDSRLFTDSTPSGRSEQRGRVTVRLRAENRGSQRVTLDAPTLRVGRVRIPIDSAGDRFVPFAAGASQTVTLRFALAGEATSKVVRDRRARILVAGRSLPIRIRVRKPST